METLAINDVLKVLNSCCRLGQPADILSSLLGGPVKLYVTRCTLLELKGMGSEFSGSLTCIFACLAPAACLFSSSFMLTELTESQCALEMPSAAYFWLEVARFDDKNGDMHMRICVQPLWDWPGGRDCICPVAMTTRHAAPPNASWTMLVRALAWPPSIRPGSFCLFQRFHVIAENAKHFG
jgi:hypothetical protein